MSDTEARPGVVEDVQTLAELMQHYHLYELIDPLLSDPGLGDAKDWDECVFIDNPFFDHPRNKRLRLQPMTGSSVAIWKKINARRELVDSAPDQPRALCGWVISQYPMEPIARFMSQQLLQTKPSGRKALLRYYDPRVMQRLWSILSREQLSTLVSSLEHWLFLDHAGQLRVISTQSGLRKYRQISIAEEQWRKIDRIGLINRTLAHFAKLAPLSELDDADIENLDRLLAVAEREGVDDDSSRMAFAIHGLGSSLAFYRHPKVMRVLASCREGGDYRLLTQEWSKDVWQRIAEDTREITV